MDAALEAIRQRVRATDALTVFEAVDEDQSGAISADELTRALHAHDGMHLDREVALVMIRLLNERHDGNSSTRDGLAYNVFRETFASAGGKERPLTKERPPAHTTLASGGKERSPDHPAGTGMGMGTSVPMLVAKLADAPPPAVHTPPRLPSVLGAVAAVDASSPAAPAPDACALGDVGEIQSSAEGVRVVSFQPVAPWVKAPPALAMPRPKPFDLTTPPPKASRHGRLSSARGAKGSGGGAQARRRQFDSKSVPPHRRPHQRLSGHVSGASPAAGSSHAATRRRILDDDPLAA